MKTKTLFLALLLAAPPAFAQSASSGDVISRPRDSSGVAATNSLAGSYSLDELADQIGELRSEVESTLPLLNSITQATTNAHGQQGAAGTIAGVLGSILNQNTNATDEAQPAGTNVLGGILRGVLGTNAPQTAASGAGIEADLVALRQHLQAIEPILNRLDSGTLSTHQTAASSGASTNELERTGRD